MKTPENLSFPGVFRGYIRRPSSVFIAAFERFSGVFMGYQQRRSGLFLVTLNRLQTFSWCSIVEFN